MQFQEQMGATDAAAGSPRRVKPINNHGIGCATPDVQRVEISVTQSAAVRHIHGRVEQALFSLFAQQRGSGNAGAVGTNSVNRSGTNRSRTLSFRPSPCGDKRRSGVRQSASGPSIIPNATADPCLPLERRRCNGFSAWYSPSGTSCPYPEPVFHCRRLSSSRSRIMCAFYATVCVLERIRQSAAYLW
jgi:hypothetical protein